MRMRQDIARGAKLRLVDEEAAYATCVADGLVIEVPVDKGKARALLDGSKASAATADGLAKSLGKGDWTQVFNSNYNALKAGIEAILLLDGMTTSDERCLMAAICIRHPEMELDWKFLESMRLKMDRPSDQGVLSREDWKGIELQAKLYIRSIWKELENRLAE
jgi:hypothetical protein